MRHVLALLLLAGCTPEPPPDLDDDNANADDDDSNGNDGNPGSCNGDGELCDVNGDCCGFEDGESVCVSDQTAAYCLPYCTGPSECSTFCCAPLDNGGGACVPEEFCGGGGTTTFPGSSGGSFL